ncbi:hypothetical protein C0J52_05521 [Blattella germanica]|nr:hypothetical protein C0J52_05521 [Blattella germanica]
MEQYIDLDDSSNSNSKFDHSDYSTDTGECTQGPAGASHLTDVNTSVRTLCCCLAFVHKYVDFSVHLINCTETFISDIVIKQLHFIFQRITAALKKLTQNDNMKFMENFDPERSNREKRKLTRKIYTGGRKQMNLYDEKGILISVGKDLCDCLDDTCPGCHFPCPKCHSCKCGHECRVNRKWMYDSIEIEGTDEVIRNKFR